MKRGWIASAVAALLFAGGVAAVGEITEVKPTNVPNPGPGASATYTVVPLGDGEDFGIEQVIFTWGDVEPVHDDAFNVRLAWPVFVELVGTDWQHRLWTYYDAETREPLFDGQETVRPYSWPTANFFGATAGSNAADLELSFNLYEETRGFCGLLDGPRIDPKAKSVALTGHCDRLDGTPVTDFQKIGHLAYESPDDARFQVHYKAHVPFPTVVTVPFSDLLLWMGWTDVVWQLELDTWTSSATSYQSVPALVEPGTLPEQRQLTQWILDDSDLDHPFPLSEAWQVTIQDNPDTQEFLASRPDAYLQAAWARRERDGSGNHMHTWALTWTDGDDWHAKLVRKQAGGLFGVSSDQLPPDYVYGAHEPGHVQWDLPTKDQLPATLPSPKDIIARQQVIADTDEELTRYGFQAYCVNGCADVEVIIAGGDFTSDRFDRSNDPQANINVATDGFHYGYNQLMVVADGTIAYTEKSRSETQPLVPIGEQGGDGEEQGTDASTWTPPTVGQTASVGLVAILSGLLVYVAPALKAPLLGLFSRIRGEHLLEHPARAAIMSAIEAEPGVHFQELLRRLDLGRSTLDHHLQKLSQGGLVRAKVSPGYTCYFPRKVDRHQMDAAPFLRAPGPKAILQEVVHGKDGRVAAISRTTGLSTSTVSHHLGRMKKAGLVEGGGRSGFRPTPKAMRVI